jgi:hypothetical protein
VTINEYRGEQLNRPCCILNKMANVTDITVTESQLDDEGFRSQTVVMRREPWWRHPTLIYVLKSTAINFLLPFINGVMLGFGEIAANELAFKYGWFGLSRATSTATLGLRGTVPASATATYKSVAEKEIAALQKTKESQQLERSRLVEL